MIKLLDYWTLMLYHFSNSRWIRRNDDLEWFRATTCLWTFTTLGVNTLFNGFVLLWDYFFEGSSLLLFAREFQMVILWTLCFGCGAFLCFYYTKYKHPEKLEEKFQALSKNKQLRYKITIWFLEIAIPIGFYCAFRMVAYGHIHV